MLPTWANEMLPISGLSRQKYLTYLYTHTGSLQPFLGVWKSCAWTSMQTLPAVVHICTYITTQGTVSGCINSA